MDERIKEAINKRAETLDNGCVRWTGPIARGQPKFGYMTETGKRRQLNPQRTILVDKLGLDPNKQYSYITTCGDPLCVNPEHIELSKRSYERKVHTARKIKCSNMKTHKAVLSILTLGADAIASKLRIDTGMINRLRQHSVMYPYLQHKIVEALPKDVTLSAVREFQISRERLLKLSGFKLFVMDYIYSENNYPVFAFDLYDKLLDECAVVGEHLFWLGDKDNDGEPVFTLVGGKTVSARGAFMHALFGSNIEENYRCTCGSKDCVNPYHLELVKTDGRATGSYSSYHDVPPFKNKGE